MSTETTLTAEQAAANAGVIRDKMRTLQQGMQARLDAYAAFVDSIDEALADPEVDARALTTADFTLRAMELVDSITHIHTGSSDNMHMLDLRRALVRSAVGDSRVARGW